MFFFTYTAAVLTILLIVTAAFLFLKGKKDILTHIFILYILSDALWIGSNAVADLSREDGILILSSGVGFIASSCIVTFFLIFVDAFIDEKLPSTERFIIYTVPTLLFTIFSFSEYAVIDTIYPANQPAQIVPGVQYYFFLVFLFGSLVYVLFRLTGLFLNSSGKRRLQTLYITIGFLSLFIGGVTFGIVLPLAGELRFYNLAPQFSFILVFTTIYAIYKHNLLDIRLALQRGFIYSVLFFIIISFYLAIITLTGFFLQQITATTILINAGITSLFGIFTVPYIDRFLRKKTDRFFFKDTYNYAETLYELSEEINKSMQIEDIKERMEVSLQNIFKANFAVIRFAQKDAALSLRSKVQKADAAEITIPIIFNGTVIGTIHLGEKNSGDHYTSEDIVLIRTFSYQVAAAFEKAKLYSEVQQYSHELEKRVEERTRQITELQEQQTQMMLDISHKLQTPLTIAKAQLNRMRKESSDERFFDFFEKTIDETSAFVYDLLDLARLEAIPSDNLEKASHNLSEHLTELAEYFEVMASQNQIEFRSEIVPAIDFTYNKAKITEMLTNFVSNAVKYSNKEEANRWVELRLWQTSASVCISVADNGIGIPEADIPRVFDRFYRTPATRSIHGTGLGLAICKKIVDLHDGTIEVESDGQKGTLFTMTFPRPTHLPEAL